MNYSRSNDIVSVSVCTVMCESGLIKRNDGILKLVIRKVIINYRKPITSKIDQDVNEKSILLNCGVELLRGKML